MPRNWKADIISLTELPEARAKKIDASFFPPVSEEKIQDWEEAKGFEIPDEIRSFLTQSDGLEAQEGELWSVLPLDKWVLVDDACASSTPLLRFGESKDYTFTLSLGHSPSIYREEKYGPGEEFFASGFHAFLEKVFQGKS